MCSFAAYLEDEGLSPQTGKTYLAAVRNMQISLGLPDPREESVVQAGISRARLLKGAPAMIRLPITAQLLGQIRTSLEKSSHRECCTAFFGFFQLGELLTESAIGFNQRLHLAWGMWQLMTGRTHIWCGYTQRRINSVRASTSYWAV